MGGISLNVIVVHEKEISHYEVNMGIISGFGKSA